MHGMHLDGWIRALISMHESIQQNATATDSTTAVTTTKEKVVSRKWIFGEKNSPKSFISTSTPTSIFIYPQLDKNGGVDCLNEGRLKKRIIYHIICTTALYTISFLKRIYQPWKISRNGLAKERKQLLKSESFASIISQEEHSTFYIISSGVSWVASKR